MLPMFLFMLLIFLLLLRNRYRCPSPDLRKLDHKTFCHATVASVDGGASPTLLQAA
jgi:hypothetical protein